MFINLKLYIFFAMVFLFLINTATAETSDENKLDTLIELMERAVEEAEKGNFFLGDPSTPCPGYEDLPVPDFTRETYCKTPAFACRCL